MRFKIATAVVVAGALAVAGCGGSSDRASEWTTRQLDQQIRTEAQKRLGEQGVELRSLQIRKLDDHNARGIVEAYDPASGQSARVLIVIEIGKTGAVSWHPEGDPAVTG